MVSNKKIKRIAVVVGTRPNFMKAAPFLLRACEYKKQVRCTLIHTGQHFDKNMSDSFLKDLNLPNPVTLDITGDTHTEKIGKMVDRLKKVLIKAKYDMVVVVGDTNSTLAGALAAVKNNIPLAHIEAGLRSFDRRMPEEINRVIIDHLSELLFITEPSAKVNLFKEGVDDSKVKYVGNIMIESLEIFSRQIENSTILDQLSITSKGYVVCTIHRAENTDHPVVFGTILKMLGDLSKHVKIVLPLHPGSRQKIKKYRLNHLLKKIIVIDPLSYFDFVKLVKNSRGVVTDSGGLQEETSYMGIPCCTLRDNTERPITIEKGTNTLFPIEGLSKKDAVKKIIRCLRRTEKRKTPILFWDDKVSDRIIKEIVKY